MPQKHHYRLVYFDTRGKAEVIRLIFKYFDIEFEDFRVNKEDWPELKKVAPMGQVPFLEIDRGEVVLCQSIAIARYLAKSLKPTEWFAGATKTDAAKCDMYVDSFMELLQSGLEAHYEQDEGVKMEKTANFMQAGHHKLELLENHLKKSGGEFFVGRKCTYTDLVALCVIALLDEYFPHVLAEIDLLKKYYFKMRRLPHIREYIEDHWPVSNFDD